MVEQSKNISKEDTSARKRGPAAIPQTDAAHKFAVTIGRPVEEVFTFWRDFNNLTSFMKDVENVQATSSKKSHWTVRLKSGLKVEWDAEITSELPNQMISWRSVEGSEVMTNGTVWFSLAPAGKGTVVSLSMEYGVPGGKLTELVTKLFGEDPDTLIQINLHRLKALLETGDIPTTEGQSSGRAADAQSTPSLKH